MDELDVAIREAYSLVPGTYTGNLRYLGAAETKYGDITRYYCNDHTGEYFYNSVAMERFELEMQEAKRRKRLCLKN